MAGRQNPIDNEGLTNEYREFLQKFNSAIREIDEVNYQIDEVSTRFQGCLKRLEMLSEKATLRNSLDLASTALRSIRRAITYDRNQLRPFLHHLGESREGFQTNAKELKVTPNLKTLQEELSKTQKLLIDARQVAVDCESEFRQVDQSLSYIIAMLDQTFRWDRR